MYFRIKIIDAAAQQAAAFYQSYLCKIALDYLENPAEKRVYANRIIRR